MDRVILKVFMKIGNLWTGPIWLMLGASGRLIVNVIMNFESYKTREIYMLAELILIFAWRTLLYEYGVI